MSYVIWIVSLFVGAALVMQGDTVALFGWLVIVGGLLAGYALGRRKDEDRLAKKIADAQRE